MSWIIAIIVGGLIGWIASLIMSTDSQQGIVVNIVVGIVGSILGAWLFGNVLGIGSAENAGTWSLWGIIWGTVGAVILVAILRIFKVYT
jgi:uncharacterized membrane protein YeaQ/YmgE (transglycosylase-associated protein family)